MKRKELKKYNITQLIFVLIAIVLINFIASFVFFRVDLTSENRYTIAQPTKDFLKEIDDVVYFQIYLDGDLPYGFLKLQRSLKETLEEFRVIANDNIQYEFFDPAESPDKKTRNEIFRQLYEKGIQPTNLQLKEKDGSSSQKIIFPGLIITYKGRNKALNILKNNPLYSPEINLNNSIQSLEYEIIQVLKTLNDPLKPDIAFIQGHNELDEYYTADILNSLSESFQVERVEINGQIAALKDYELIVIAKPDSLFDEKDKYIIDQFIMNGGKSLWLIDYVKADMDSLAYSSATLATNNQLNIEDQLFKYGVRINYNLIQDMQCAVIPVNTSVVGAQAQFAPAPWLYFPLITPKNNHPITKNTNLVKLEFASVIDTVGFNPEIKKTILLESSKYSKLVRSPVRISLDLVNQQQVPERFPEKNLPVAVLLEGKFESVFKNRLTSELLGSKEISFKDKSKPTKMIVISDGDIIKNQIRKSGNQLNPFPLGYDRYTQQTFGNKEFITNSINFLIDESGIMDIRNRELKIRLLDKQKTINEDLKWQIINILIPLIFICIFGVAWYYIRKRKFTK